jgi:uncharacterized protein (DUF58 family)
MSMSGVFLLAGWRRYRKLLVLSVLIISAYVGAVGRGESLLWVMAALLLATLVTAISWPHWLVRQLVVSRRGPERANEGDMIVFRVEIDNRGRLPRFMVEVVDRLPFVDAVSGAGTTGKKVLGVVAFVRGRASRSFGVSVLCEKRGFYQLGPVSLASSFPLGLLEARQHRDTAAQTLLIYPQVYPIVSMPLHGTPSQIHRGAFLLPEAAGAAEFCGLREYRRGDNPRHIHWPTSARAGELMVREFEPLASACLCLALDLAVDANVGKGRHSTLEYAVKIAASIARYAANNGMPIRLVGQGRRSLVMAGASGEHHYRNILEELAIAASDGSTPYARLLEDVAMDCTWGETVVVFLSEPDSRTEKTLQALALLRSCGAQILAVSFERSSFTGETGVRPSDKRGARATLLDLGASYLYVCKGDDLLHLLNP